MRGKRLITSVVMASALTVPFLMPTGAQAQSLIDLGGLLGTGGSFGGLAGVLGNIGSPGAVTGVIPNLLEDSICAVPLLGRCFSDDIATTVSPVQFRDISSSDDDVFRFRRSPIIVNVDDGFHDGFKNHHHRCFIEPWLCKDGRFHDGKFHHGGKFFHDGRFHDGRFHDGRFFHDPFVTSPVVTAVPVGVPVATGGQLVVSNNNNNNNNVVGGGGGGASSSASSSSSS